MSRTRRRPRSDEGQRILDRRAAKARAARFRKRNPQPEPLGSAYTPRTFR